MYIIPCENKIQRLSEMIKSSFNNIISQAIFKNIKNIVIFSYIKYNQYFSTIIYLKEGINV